MHTMRLQLWIALVCLAVGALMLHYRIHPPQSGLTHFWATLLCCIDLVVVSTLFLFRSTAVWGLLANSFIAYLGIIMMGDLSIVSTLKGAIRVSPREQPLAWLLQTTFPDIAILVGDMLVGMVLYRVIVTTRERNA